MEKPFEYPLVPKDEEILDPNESSAASGAKEVDAPPSLPPPQPSVALTDAITMTEPPPLASSFSHDTSIIPMGNIGDPDGTRNGLKGITVVEIGSLDNSPKTKFQVTPQYPYALKAAGITGQVMVEFTVDETGRVINPHVLSSTHPEFEAPTLRAVQAWRFEPGKHQGRVVRFRMNVPVQFSISDRD